MSALEEVLLGSQDRDAQQALTAISRAAENVVLLHQVLVRLEDRIRTGRAVMAGGAPASTGRPFTHTYRGRA